MTAESSKLDSRSRNRLLTHAAGVLRDLGRTKSAEIIERYLRPDFSNDKAQASFGIHKRFQPPTAGYQIAERLQINDDSQRWKLDRSIMGIIGDEAVKELQPSLIPTELPFDSYDRVLAENAPDILVIEPDALVKRFGWQHALTLRDPAATAELATMIQKSRAAGIRVILIRPPKSYRFPLLSRIIDLFDYVVDNPAEIMNEYLT